MQINCYLTMGFFTNIIFDFFVIVMFVKQDCQYYMVKGTKMCKKRTILTVTGAKVWIDI